MQTKLLVHVLIRCTSDNYNNKRNVLDLLPNTIFILSAEMTKGMSVTKLKLKFTCRKIKNIISVW